MDDSYVEFDAFGARITSFLVVDKHCAIMDLAVGPDNASTRHEDWHYFGAVVGRVAGRISNAQIEIEGETFALEPNNGPNLLHGGKNGFGNKLWTIDPEVDLAASQIRFSLTDKHFEQAFPGDVNVSAHYSWETGRWLELEITAHTSKPTPLNLTQHIYWNLGGSDTETICDHLLQVHADRYLPVHEDLLPTGELRSVEQTAFDFRSPRKISDCLDSRDPQIAIAKGIDHCWALDGAGFREVANLSNPDSGLQMAIWTDQPGLQIYTANHLGEGQIGKGGRLYQKHAGIAFETQGFPDALNHPHFPSIIVRPGELYRNRTRFVFTNE